MQRIGCRINEFYPVIESELEGYHQGEILSQVLRTFAGGDMTFILTMDITPSLLPWQYGITYLGAFVNLVPTFFFGSAFNRAILVPKHIWAMAAFPFLEALVDGD